jgi:predicted negative regulator of RcsB-dependent stress response
MEKRINWLHITDLHYGQHGQNILLPKIKQEFFKDIEYVKEQIGKIDIVFFTGDLTQSGKKEEFDQLSVFLNELWSLFKKLNCEPLLLAVPGNHDLERPDLTRAVVKVLNNYSNDDELRESLWTNLGEQSEYYEAIKMSFLNFSEWYKNVSIPKPKISDGLIPGDFATSISINGIKLNVVGLNTAFLELSNSDYKGKLAVHPQQFINLLGSDPLSWASCGDISILLTHHDASWYDKESLDYYNNDLNPPKTFYTHLCGHLHEPNTFTYNFAGSAPRKTQLAPSLFGLQKTKGNIDRLHGYYAGSYILEETHVIRELFYPRKAIKRYVGEYGIEADNGFNLNKKGFIETTTAGSEIFTKLDSTEDFNQDETKKTDELQLADNKENILDMSANQVNQKELEKIPKAIFNKLKQHTAIRLVEQKTFVDLIMKEKVAWLITDWGLNEAGFIGSVSEQLEIDTSKGSFIINCEDIATREELLRAFENQFTVPLQRFCNLAEKLERPLLIFDHLNITLYQTPQAYHSFLSIIQSILDYCPKMFITLIARQQPSLLQINEYVKLTPLDAPQIKTYVQNHPSNTDELELPQNILKLEELTSGLPKHIDRIVENLKVATFEELFEAERESSLDTIATDQIPKSLIQAINGLIETSDRLKKRSFQLLKILTILANGEIYSNVHRFNANEPIYIDNPNELEGLSLLEVVTSNRIVSKVSGTQPQPIKILRIPRQIRDYVNTLITENEKDEILRLACDMYFGNRWREGSIKDIYGSSFLKTQKFYNVDNCHLLINKLMVNAIKNNDENGVERAAQVAINFCKLVYDAGDYKNAINTAEEVYTWLKPTQHNKAKAAIAKILGEALRMSGNREKALSLLTEALEIEDGNLANSEKNDIYVELGFSYITDSNFQKAIECAKAIEKTASKDVQSIQASYIMAQATLKEDKLLSRLKTLESQAKQAKSESLVNTISLRIAEINNDKKDSEKRFTQVLSSKNDDYNKMRALIKRSIEILKHGDGKISDEELLMLNYTYSYLYVQRLSSLFTNCHIALWLYCLNNSRVDDLLNLYKHSSLVWRISGQNDIEKDYFNKIEKVIDENKLDHTSLNYGYFNRRKLELA